MFMVKESSVSLVFSVYSYLLEIGFGQQVYY